MRANVTRMLEAATWLDDTEPDRGPSITWAAQDIRDGVAELQAHRAMPPVTRLEAGPSVEERLDRCRDRASRIVAADIATGNVYKDATGEETSAAVAKAIENLAHAMLAAERPASPAPDRAAIVETLEDIADHLDTPDHGGWRIALRVAREMLSSTPGHRDSERFGARVVLEAAKALAVTPTVTQAEVLAWIEMMRAQMKVEG